MAFSGEDKSCLSNLHEGQEETTPSLLSVCTWVGKTDLKVQSEGKLLGRVSFICHMPCRRDCKCCCGCCLTVLPCFDMNLTFRNYNCPVSCFFLSCIPFLKDQHHRNCICDISMMERGDDVSTSSKGYVNFRKAHVCVPFNF